MRFHLITFGCRVNQAESLAIEAQLRARGAEPVAPERADLIIVNSCSVTATADQGTRQTIRRVARDNPAVRILVTGCYATRCPEEVASLPNVEAVIGNDWKDRLVDELSARSLTTAERFGGGDGPCGAPDASGSGEGTPAPVMFPGMGGRTAFTLRVQTGCEEQCSYCIIPSTRGRSRSTPIEALVREVRRIEAAGFREVTLTGVHIGAYGRDLEHRASLSQLLVTLIASTQFLRFRLGSLEPMDCTPQLLEIAAAHDRLAPAFHLPLQHASDDMLARMRRPYSCAAYDALVRRIRSELPHASIGSDVIVGFPGERDADAERLEAYLAASPLTSLHVFPYSDRPGTEASRLPDKVHGAVVRARSERVRAIGRALGARFQAAQDGTVRQALVIEDGGTATTDNGLKVRLDTAVERNLWTHVRLRCEAGVLRGEVLDRRHEAGAR